MVAESFLRAAHDFCAWIEGSAEPSRYSESLQATKQLCHIIDDEFDLDLPAHLRRPKRSAEIQKLHRQLAYQKRARQSVEQELKTVKGDKCKGLLTSEVFVRVGLSEPSINGRQLSDVLSAGGLSMVSHTYVQKIRDTFSQLLKKFVFEQVIIPQGKANPKS